ncbi:MAG: response regulator [Gammaproteobacteria bacterium]|nr:MAG: response regulator [Gammaproteobacteria bacterium]
MAHKCALIVDDSRTARHFLARILERYDMQVETAASAEEALEYLSHSRPDVIFMDHMMPGMDGFQAVRAIKNNPDTATIPIMMYTSQAGELYVSQARALGAVGVLPKQIKPVEVDELLRSLHLVPDGGEPAGSTAVAQRAASHRDAVDRALRPADWDDLHRWFRQMLGHHGRSLREDIEQSVSRVLDERLATLSAAQAAREHRPGAGRWLSLALAGLAALLFWLQLDGQARWQAAADRNAELLAALERQRKADAEDDAGIREYLDAERASLLRQYDDYLATLEWGLNQAGAYPPGEPPLGDARVELLRGLVERLERIGFSGTVRLVVQRGDFCLVPDRDGNWQPAPADLPVDACTRFGEPPAAPGGGAVLESRAFANFRAELEDRGGPVRIEIADAGERLPPAPYPADGSALAGDWNRAAVANHRVQVRLLPDGELPAGAWPAADLR